MEHFELLSELHTQTKRDYRERVVTDDKAYCATIAKKWDQEYWDGDRRFGYGGYTYDGRWNGTAHKIIERYKLSNSSKVLDIGCGKAFLLYEIKKILPEIEVAGIDVSKYGIENAPKPIIPFLTVGTADDLPYQNNYFDLVFTINVFHNLKNYELFNAFHEMKRVAKDKMFFCTESYRTEEEKVNLLYWQLTCETFFSVKEWLWYFKHVNYQGDYDFIFFE